MLAAFGLTTEACIGEGGGPTFRVLARGFSAKVEIGPIWGRFGGRRKLRFESRILSKIRKSDVKT